MLCWFYRAAAILLLILTGSSSETNAMSSDCAYHVGNVKVEEDLEMREVEGEMNVKTEKDIGSEEEDCMGLYSEGEEKEEEDIDTKEEEDVGIKEEVSLEDTV